MPPPAQKSIDSFQKSADKENHYHNETCGSHMGDVPKGVYSQDLSVCGKCEKK